MSLRGGMGHRKLPRLPSDRVRLRICCCSCVQQPLSSVFLLWEDKGSDSSWRQSARITCDLFQLPPMTAFPRTRVCSPLLQVPLTHHRHQNTLRNIKKKKKAYLYIYCTHWTVLTYLCTDQSLFPASVTRPEGPDRREGQIRSKSSREMLQQMLWVQWKWKLYKANLPERSVSRLPNNPFQRLSFLKNLYHVGSFSLFCSDAFNQIHNASFGGNKATLKVS